MVTNYSYSWFDKGYKPPPGEVAIDWSHPMARCLSGIYLFNERGVLGISNLIRPQRFTVGATGLSFSSKGLKFDGNGYLYTQQNANLITKYPYTIIIYCKNSTDQQGYFFTVGNSNNSWYTYLGYTALNDKAAALGRWGGTGVTMTGSNNHWQDRVNFHTYAWVSNSQTDSYIYWDFAQIDADTTDMGNSFTYTNNDMVIGASTPSGTSKVGNNGELAWAMVYDGRALSLLEQRMLSYNPYQFLIPKWETYSRWKTTAAPPSVGSSIFGGSVFSGPITIGPIVR